MKKVIYSIKEIEKKAIETYQDRELKKDWLSKQIELISSKTVLKDLKVGETYIEEANITSEIYEKIRLYQQALGHYFLAYFRSHGKDRKAEKELEDTKEEYYSHLFNYFLKIVDNFESYEKDLDFIKELANILKNEEKFGNTKEPLEEFYYNLDAYNLYKSVIQLELEDINLIRNKFKELKESKSKVIEIITKRMEITFNNNAQYLEKIIGNSNLLIKVDRIKLQKSLRYIKYFNLKLYNKYKNVITNFYTLRSIRTYIETEYTYEDYEGLERNYILFEKLPKLDNENKLVEDNEKYLYRILSVYNEAYIEYNFSKIFNQETEFNINYLFSIEKYLRKLESSDYEILKEIGQLSLLEKELDRAIKIEEILLLLKRSNLTFVDFLTKKLENQYKKTNKEIDNIDNYKLSILNKKTDEMIVLFKKNIVDIGRKEDNDIVIFNKYISRKHLTFNLEKNEIINGFKDENPNVTYYNNQTKIFDKLNLTTDRIQEINLGNLFTFNIEETEEENFFITPLLEKTNKDYLTENEINEFEKKSYLLVKNQGRIPIKMNNKDKLFVVYEKGIQISRENKMPRTIKLGLNYFDNKYEYILERV